VQGGQVEMALKEGQSAWLSSAQGPGRRLWHRWKGKSGVGGQSSGFDARGRVRDDECDARRGLGVSAARWVTRWRAACTTRARGCADGWRVAWLGAVACVSAAYGDLRGRRLLRRATCP
jgi:hypothetical protein